MPGRILKPAFVVYFLFSFLSCDHKKTESENALFQLMPSSTTGIRFVNQVEDTKDFNIFRYRNFYNGAGVAIGDVNNDGMPDIFFTSNQHDNKLYINKGNWEFEDVTEKSGIRSVHKWHTGVTMVDINGDGWLDIYLCNSGEVPGDDRSNELYINQKDGTFKEEAHEYGLDDKGQSTQAIFFDYDHDGDLDCFVLNNSNRSVESFGYDKNLRNIRDPKNGDRLYRNDGGHFVDVSAQAGIYGSEIGFGLGVTVGDVNNDGWEDIYVSNDYFERDYLYINQHNGTFKEVIDEAMGHISQGSMGSDMADINNDGYLDIFTTEMLPENDYKLKTTIKFDNYDLVNAKNQMDFHHQFTSNCLQLNNKDGTFSEISQYSGIDASGWSWGALSFDFDNDGWKDIYVCNGISKDLTNQDFLEYFSSRGMQEKVMQQGLNFSDILKIMPTEPLINCAFVNQKNLVFKKESQLLGFTIPTFSNGAAYGDLDGDGDLDLVINNENMEASVYRNMASEQLHHHFLKIKLNGNPPNTFGLGARVTLYANGIQQMLEQMPSRGFESSVDPVLNFGLGETNTIDSLVVRWPGGKYQLIIRPRADTTIVLHQVNAIQIRGISNEIKSPLFSDVTATQISGNIRHKENDHIDFKVENLIPKMLSTEGPKLAVGDVNGDGLEDFYMGGASGDTAKLFIQQKNGHFEPKFQAAFAADKDFENIGAVFFDADHDGDLDLLVASGGNQARLGSPLLEPRLYLNDGKGNFKRAGSGWPNLSLNASCVRTYDFDGDGFEDIFIGARNIPGRYGIKPASVLLHNDGNGKFTDITNAVAPVLLDLGMVTDAQWADVDGDGKKELIVVGDWMPVTILKYLNGRLQKIREIKNSSGWWNCIEVSDLNGDGFPDLVAGNWGLNSRIKADSLHPAKLYISDFAMNGRTECIPVYYKTDGKAYPYFMKGEIETEIPQLKKKFLKFSEYAGKGIEDIFSPIELKRASVLTVEQTQTSVFINDGRGNFTLETLPARAQFSPVFGIISTDLNGDGMKDLFLAGNFYGVKPQTGRFDASYGTSFLANAKHQYDYDPPDKTGLFIKGEARDIASIKTVNGESLIIVAMNNENLYIFKPNNHQ